jgi:hypothetical protein
MKRYGYRELQALQMKCTATENPEDVRAWIEEQGIDPGGFNTYIQRFGTIASTLLEEAGPEKFAMGIFGCGFEMGVRFQQEKEPPDLAEGL